jgi:polyketide synthase 12/myxalamid-type polyketide synthase MxaB
VVPINWAVFMKQYRRSIEPPFFAELVRGMQTEVKAKQQHQEKRTDLFVQLQEAPANKRKPLLIAYIQSQVGKVLGWDSGQKVNEHIPLSEMGLDSLMAVEVRNLLGSGFNLKRALPATLVFDYPTVAAIADYIMNEMDLIPTDAKQESPSTKPNEDISGKESMDNLLDQLEGLSDEEVDRLLAEQMKEGKRNNE